MYRHIFIISCILSIISIGCEDENEEKKTSQGKLLYNDYTYNTIIIGSQEWTSENLRTTKYNDGTPITYISYELNWGKNSSGAYCAYKYNETNAIKSGFLYNWYAVNSGYLVPKSGGWRVPTKDDWTKLTDFIGSKDVHKLMSKSGWDGVNGTDDYGFNALPGGQCDSYGSCSLLTITAYWWCSTSYSPDNAWCFFISNRNEDVSINGNLKRAGLSVRLVRDR